MAVFRFIAVKVESKAEGYLSQAGGEITLVIITGNAGCIAIWMASASKDMTGKILAIFFPIWLFITSGFEHSVANMYYIPAGILAKANEKFAQAAISLGVSAEQISNLNWGTLFTRNLIPVTLGNIVGGAFFVGTIYWFVYLRKGKSSL